MSNPAGWHYRHQGKTVGPVSETELDTLVQNGTLTPETFVWQKGLPQWKRYRDLRGVPGPVESAPIITGPAASAGSAEVAQGPKSTQNWYYVQEGQSVGPVGEAELDALVQNGSLSSDTYVFREGMSDWQPYAAVKALPPAAAPDTQPAPTVSSQPDPVKPLAVRVAIAKSAPPVAAAVNPSSASVVETVLPNASTDAMAVCAECGKVDQPQALLYIGQSLYCPKCHRQTTARLRHEALIRYASPAGFWIRFLARLLDAIVILVLLGIAGVLLTLIGLPMAKMTNDLKSMRAIFGISSLLLLLGAYSIPLVYFTLMHGLLGASLGKLVLRLRVVHVSGAKLSCFRAFYRVLMEIVAVFLAKALTVVFAQFVLLPMVENHPLLVIILVLVVVIPLSAINYLWVMFSEQKFAWHDIFARTRVLKLN